MNNLDDAHELIDTAISTALKESKPVYISIGCNLPGIPHPTFARDPVPFYLAPKYVFCFVIQIFNHIFVRVNYTFYLVLWTDFHFDTLFFQK